MDVEELVAEWPWAVRQLFLSPNPKTIRAHAKTHLQAALASGRLTAFVGSGASAAYGRATWAELIEATVRHAVWAYKRARGQQSGDPFSDGIVELLETFKSTPPTRAGAQHAAFQLAVDLSQRTRPLNGANPRSARDLAAQWVRDSAGHARLLLDGMIETINDRTTAERLEKWLGDANHLPPGSVPRWPRQWLKRVNYAKVSLEATDLVTPSRMHRVIAHLCLLSENDLAKRLSPMPSLVAPKTPDRSDLVPADRDPLQLLLHDLLIRRFLTINYDVEIERMFRDAKFSEVVGNTLSDGTERSRAVESEPLAPAYQAEDFDQDRVGHLATLAARRRQRSGWVVHLHGRAEEGAKIIATEDDYRERYARLDRSRTTIDDAIRVAFGASPLLFLGIGFTEVDLMRPLRQFMSDPGRMGDRLAIALMPRLDKKPDADREAIDLLQRYGVYTIHYGTAKTGLLPEDDEWLHKVKSASDAILKALRDSGAPRVSAKHRNLLTNPPAEIEGADSKELEGDLRDMLTALTALRQRLSPRKRFGYQVLCAGAFASILTFTLCAALRRLATDARGGAEPTDRLRTLETPAYLIARRSRKGARAPKLDYRHAVRLATGKDSRWSSRFFSGAASQTFNHLAACLGGSHHLLRVAAAAPARVILVAASRGSGRGHFFRALTSSRFSEFCDHLYTKPSPDVFYFFANLSFSVEAASVFDRLVNFLWRVVEHVTPDRAGAHNELAHERIASLSRAISELATLAEKMPKPEKVGASAGMTEPIEGTSVRPFRVLVALNGIHIFFDEQGQPKNRQVREIFDALLQETAAPIDFVFCATDHALPQLSSSRAPAWTALEPVPNADPKLSLHLSRTKRRLGLNTATPETPENTPTWFVHFLHHARGSIMAFAYFPVAALAIADHAVPAKDTAASPTRQVEAWRRVSIPEAFGFFSEFSKASPTCHLKEHPKQAYPLVIGAMLKASRDDRTAQSPFAIVFGTPADGPGRYDVTPSRLTKWVSEAEGRAIDGEFRTLYQAVGGSRYALTLVLAHIDEIVRSQEAVGVARRVDQFISDLKTLFGVPERDRSQRAVSLIIERLKKLHQDKNPFPLTLIPFGRLEGHVATAARTLGEEWFILQEWLLWQLAIVSIPVDAQVLSYCPQVRKAAARLLKNPDATTRRQRQIERVIAVGLELLQARCLVYELEPETVHEGDDNGGVISRKGPIRFTLHRLLQRHVLGRIASRHFSYPENDPLSLTMYADQPNDTPHLSLEAHRDIRRAAMALSRHPEALDATDDTPASFTANINAVVKTRMLRAAYGIVRSTYSISTIAHFDEKHGDYEQRPYSLGTPGTPGFFEEQRRLLLWLLRESQEPRDGRPALYPEDLVWLHNELGTISLAQGAISEANSRFVLADEAAKRTLEGHVHSPLRSLICLNHAITNIERGKLAYTRSVLDALLRALLPPRKPDGQQQAATPDASQAQGHAADIDRASHVYWIARGYRARVSELMGQTAEASEGYRQAIARLQALSRSRAASIFARYLGALLATEDSPEADTVLRRAVQLATDDDHEDVRHLALLALLRRQVMNAEHPLVEPNSRQHHSDLNAVENYGRMMGMPRLISEADEVRARLHLRTGDLQSAGTAAMASLEVCALHGLEIQKALVLLLLAEINLERYHFTASRAFLDEASQIARDTGYQPGLVDAQKLATRLRAQERSRESFQT